MTSKISKKNNIFSFIFLIQNNFAWKKMCHRFSFFHASHKENWVNVYQIIILFFRKFEAIIRIQIIRKKILLTCLSPNFYNPSGDLTFVVGRKQIALQILEIVVLNGSSWIWIHHRVGYPWVAFQRNDMVTELSWGF